MENFAYGDMKNDMDIDRDIEFNDLINPGTNNFFVEQDEKFLDFGTNPTGTDTNTDINHRI